MHAHVPAYITKGFPIVRDVKPGGVFLINCQWDFAELEHHLDAASKRYIANNNIQLYMINAIDLAREIGMGKRTNTILQSAFFTLAKVIPQEDAIRYMKEKATASYLKKGQDVVDMNHKAIDAGATAFVKVEVPESWKTAEDKADKKVYTGREKTVEMVKTILDPVDKMDGDSLPVSAFVDHADGTFELGASAYEKRGVSAFVPEWTAETCAQCNQCAFVCPHATIRPFALNEEEAAAAPENANLVDFRAGKGKGLYKYTMAISPLDCMGCGVCVNICPTKSLKMVGLESQEDKQPVFDYMVSKVSEKPEVKNDTVIGSQFKQPYLEFLRLLRRLCRNAANARLVTQLFGDHMMIFKRHRLQLHLGRPGCNLSVHRQQGRQGSLLGKLPVRGERRARSRSLPRPEEDPRRPQAQGRSNRRQGSRGCKVARDLQLRRGKPGSYKGSALLHSEKLDCGCDTRAELRLEKKDFLNEKSCWIFGGDGWAFDIGFGGVDHVLASGEDVNVFVFNTEVYSNTGGQASKAIQHRPGRSSSRQQARRSSPSPSPRSQ